MRVLMDGWADDAAAEHPDNFDAALEQFKRHGVNDPADETICVGDCIGNEAAERYVDEAFGRLQHDATVRFIVACKDTGADNVARYHLTTRQTFHSRAGADRYARTCSPSRDPLVIEGRFHQLRD